MVTGVAGMALMASPAHAGLFSDEQAREGVLALRQKTDALAAQLTAAQRTINDQSNRFDQLAQQVAVLRGQNEQMANQLATLQKQQKDYYADLDARLGKLEPQSSATGAGAGNSAVQDASSGQPAAASGEGETQALTVASQQFRSGKYKAAAVSFRRFITKYPQSQNRPAAQYWLGNALYADRDYRGSTQAWQSVVRLYPQSPHAPDALFAIANNQIEQGQKTAARRTLRELVTQYGGSGVAQSAQQRLAQLQ
jgi:tol-pal system protein YbgF